MKLYTESYYNPYFIDINGKQYEIGTIHVFDKNGSLMFCNQGWFGSNNNCRNLEIDGECVRKNTVNFECKTAFIVKMDGSESWYTNKSRYALYLPAEYLDMEEPSYHKEMNGTMHVKTMKSRKYPTVVFTENKFVDRELYNIYNQMKDISGKISSEVFPHSFNADKVNSLIDSLRILSNRMVVEKAKMESLEIEKW